MAIFYDSFFVTTTVSHQTVFFIAADIFIRDVLLFLLLFPFGGVDAVLVVERSVESVYVFIADRGGDFLNRESSRTDEFFRAFEPLCDEKLLEIFAEDFFCQPRKILYVHAEFPSTRRKASADELRRNVFSYRDFVFCVTNFGKRFGKIGRVFLIYDLFRKRREKFEQKIYRVVDGGVFDFLFRHKKFGEVLDKIADHSAFAGAENGERRIVAGLETFLEKAFQNFVVGILRKRKDEFVGQKDIEPEVVFARVVDRVPDVFVQNDDVAGVEPYFFGADAVGDGAGKNDHDLRVVMSVFGKFGKARVTAHKDFFALLEVFRAADFFTAPLRVVGDDDSSAFYYLGFFGGDFQIFCDNFVVQTLFPPLFFSFRSL